MDQLLVERGLAESREKAQALIMAGEVLVNGQKSDKPGRSVASDSQVECRRAPALRQPRRIQAGGRAGSFRHRCRRAESASTSAAPPAASPIACCSAARRASRPSTSAPASSIGSCATIRAWWSAKASTRAISPRKIFRENVRPGRLRCQLHLRDPADSRDRAAA